MVLCLLSRDSHGDTGKLNREETVRGPEIAIFPEKSEILLLILVKILKKSDSTHSSSKGAVNAYFLTGSFFKKTVVFEAAIFVGQSEDGAEVRCEVSRRVKIAVSRYSGPSGLRLRCGGCYSYQFLILLCSPGLCSQPYVLRRGLP